MGEWRTGIAISNTRCLYPGFDRFFRSLRIQVGRFTSVFEMIAWNRENGLHQCPNDVHCSFVLCFSRSNSNHVLLPICAIEGTKCSLLKLFWRTRSLLRNLLRRMFYRWTIVILSFFLWINKILILWCDRHTFGSWYFFLVTFNFYVYLFVIGITAARYNSGIGLTQKREAIMFHFSQVRYITN